MADVNAAGTSNAPQTGYRCTNPACGHVYAADPGDCGACGMSQFERIGDPEEQYGRGAISDEGPPARPRDPATPSAPAEASTSATGAAGAVPPAAPDGQAYCSDPACAQPIPAGAGACPYCGRPTEPHPAQPHPQEPGPAGDRIRPQPAVVAPGSVALLDDHGARIPLYLDREVLLGRGDDFLWASTFQHHRGVSRRHAAIEWKGTVIRVRDLGSSNGTWIDGRRIDGPIDLPARDGAVIGLGREYRLTVRTTP